MTRAFHRPARLDPDVAEQIEGNADTAATSELAHHTAQLLTGGFASGTPVPGPDRRGEAAPVVTGAGTGPAPATDVLTRDAVVDAVACHGVDQVAELWADSPATTLPGALWRLYLVREWIRRDPDLVERRYATEVDLRGADAQVLERFSAASSEGRRVPTPGQVRERLDEVLTGQAGGLAGLAPVLVGAADFLAALAAGSGATWIESESDELAYQVTRRDSALLATADELRQAAGRARVGTLD